jgi:hypothetical protein
MDAFRAGIKLYDVVCLAGIEEFVGLILDLLFVGAVELIATTLHVNSHLRLWLRS